jgi:ketosteroid isomerase-like protein
MAAWYQSGNATEEREPTVTDRAEHPNAIRVRQLFDAFRSADVNAIRETVPEDATWHFPGRHGKLAGEHQGRDAIFRFLLDVQVLTEDTFHLELLDVVANNQRAIALFRGSAQRNGKTLDNPTCLRIDFRDGRVHEIWEFVWDLFEVDDFWS